MPIEKTANYIRIRVANPSLFFKFRIKLLGKGIKAVFGFKKSGGSEIQSLLFPRNRYDMKSARAWVSSHGHKVSETFLVYEIEIDTKTLDMKFIEESVSDEEEAESPRPKREPWAWLLDDDWEWTL